MKSIFSSWRIDPIGVHLGAVTQFYHFTTRLGIDGLARTEGTRLDILAILSQCPRRGRFRKFIQECKKEFSPICIWDIWNPWLAEVLVRYGFAPASTTFYYHRNDSLKEETVQGYCWENIFTEEPKPKTTV